MAGLGRKGLPKGVSGNPSGRPKSSFDRASFIKKLNNSGMVNKALAVLTRELGNPKSKIAATVAMYVLDQAAGRPSQSVQVSGTMKLVAIDI